MKTRLFICKTPLQAKIASRIMETIPGRDTVLYSPHSTSPKQRLYFDRLPTTDKIFGRPFRPKHGDVLGQVALCIQARRLLRGREFDEIYAASLMGLEVPDIVAHVPHHRFCTFDDGTFNIDPVTLDRIIFREPMSHLIAKWILGASRNETLFRSSDTHYTVFPPRYSLIPATHTVAIDLFDFSRQRTPDKTFTLLLGTPDWSLTGTAEWSAMKRQVTERVAWDLYLPHPQEMIDPIWRIDVDPALKRAANELIAEDFVAELIKRGYDCHVYGYDSSSLFLLAGWVKTTTIRLPGSSLAMQFLIEMFGIESVWAKDVAPN